MRMIEMSEMRPPFSRLRVGVFTACMALASCFLADARATAAEISPEMLIAARNGDLATVNKLLAQGEGVNAGTAEGVTALMVAAAANHVAVVRALLEAGADARMKTASGKTAAFFASGKGNTEVAAILEEAASKQPVVPKVSLLVSADFDCTWKLDGESQGHLASGASIKVQAELGKHIIYAVTADGADQYRQVIELTKIQQELVTIGLKSVHDSRVQAEEEARLAPIRRAEEARREAARRAEQAQLEEARRAEEARREEVRRAEVAQRAEEIRIARAAPVWEDPYSGLIWATHTNGRTLKWSGAKSYCQNLTLGGQKGWRLPTKDELRGIYDPSNGPDHAAGGIQLNGHFLILTAQAPYRGPGLFDKVMGGVVSVEAAAAGTPDPGSSSSSSSSYYYFDFASGRDSVLRSPPPDGQALCVRGSGQ